jgi:hypothetical protein
MRPQLPHSVLRQYVEVDMSGTTADALALQNALAPLCRQTLLPVIEQALDRCAPRHRLIQIDRLDLDLGSVTLANLEQELPALLRRCLDTALDPFVADSECLPDGVRNTAMPQAMDDALAYFLRYATLPPGLHLAIGRDFEATLMAIWDEQGQLPLTQVSSELRAALRSAAACERLTGQFSMAFQRALLTRLGAVPTAILDDALRQVRDGRAGNDVARASKQDEHAAIERLLVRAAFGRTEHSAGCDAAALIKDALALAGENSVGASALAGALRLSANEKLNKPGEGTAGSSVNRGPTPLDHPDQCDGIYVENAGLVLLHPFLPRLFELVAICRDQDLVEPDRALALLHFLTSGQSTVPEYVLALPKLLCGLPLTANIEAIIVLTEAEKAEAMALLEAVIAHWNVLKNTSADGLRGTFLMRAGKLRERGGEWILQVEAHAADILMVELPWGVSAVRLPWMKSMLWVEWN